MALGIKYRHTFDSQVRPGLTNTWKTEILVEGFSGSVTTVTLAGTPLTFRRNPENESKMITKYRTSCNVNLICTSGPFQYHEFINSDEEEVLVNVYKNSTLFFSGWAIVDQNQFQLRNNAVFTLLATDGLSLINDKELKRANGTNFSGITSFGDYLTEFITTLGTDIQGVVDATNLVPEPLAGTASILQDLTSNVLCYDHDTFKKNLGQSNETLFTWGEWIDAVLTPLGCCLEIVDAKIHITRIDLKKDSYSAYELNTSLSQTGTTTIDNRAYIWDQKDDDRFVVDRSLFVQGDDVYKSQRVEFTPSASTGNAVINGDMSDWSTPSNINNWRKDGTLTIAQVTGNTQTYGLQLDGVLTSFNTSNAAPANSFIDSAEFQMTANDGTGQQIDLSFDVKVDASSGGSGSFNIYYQLIFETSDNTKYYYKSSNDTWSTTINYETVTEALNYNQWYTHTLDDVNFNLSAVITGKQEIQFYIRLIQIHETTTTDITDVTYENVQATLSSTEVVVQDTVTSSDNRSITPDTVTFTVGDGNNYNTRNGIKLGTTVTTGKTAKWARAGVTEDRYLSDILSETIMSDAFYGAGTWRLTGTLKGDFNFNSTIGFGSYDLGKSIRLMTTGGTYDVKRETWTAEWAQVGEDDLGAIENTLPGYLLNTDDGKMIW